MLCCWYYGLWLDVESYEGLRACAWHSACLVWQSVRTEPWSGKAGFGEKCDGSYLCSFLNSKRRPHSVLQLVDFLSNDGKMTVSSTLFVMTSLWYPPVYSDRKVFCQDSPMVHCKLHYHTSLYLGAAIIRYSLPGNSAFPNVITFAIFYSTESLQLWRISYYPGHISFYKGQDWVVFSFVCNTVKITVQALPL